MSSPSTTQSSGPPTIAAAPTSIALFIGWAPSGPTDKAVRIASFADYEAAFGKLDDERSLLGYALGHFFDNGGKHAQVLRIVGANGEAIVPADRAFTQALSAACAAGGPVDKVDIFNLVCVPGLANAATIAMLQAKAAARRALLIADCAETATVASISASLAAITGANAANSALYFPWVLAPDQLRDNVSRAFPPCGFVAGLYARTDATRGVWKEPAGTEASLAGAKDMTVVVGNTDRDQLNRRGVNCLRKLSDTVLVVWGARTLADDNASVSDRGYVPVRRLALFIEDSLYAGTKWAAFEPNGEPLWARLRASIDAFMHELFTRGAFVGNTPSQAWFVKCDATTTTLADIDNGVVNIVIGFAPIKPAEFVIITITLRPASS